ncbi:receptor expression-enhancing protein 5 [Vigna radiata var. radiata]|uniref:HVA22-like protein n=1 Tax=Vigna radiata var. radiata TaxID=3916 RepID=A0A1S3THP6_VIGRR|nr:receptor expression-enhancing protein 5 [Vigna radiata var. radiata]
MKIGLRPFLSPVAPNLFLRTACCSIGLALPVYSTFKAIEDNDPYQQQRWLLYWAAYGSFSAAEMFTEKIFSWIPFYYHAKFAFLLWLQLPTLNGARQLYSSHLRPFLLKHQARMDVIVEFVYGVMSKLIRDHQTELQFARAVAVKFLVTGTQMIRDLIHPVGRKSNNIEPQKRQVQDSESED